MLPKAFMIMTRAAAAWWRCVPGDGCNRVVAIGRPLQGDTLAMNRVGRAGKAGWIRYLFFLLY